MASPTPTRGRTIKVSVVSDITCPWCYIVSKEIERGIQRLELPAEAPVRFELEHRPYLINPSWRENEWQQTSVYFTEKMGKAKWEQVRQVVEDRCKEVGIRFKSDGVMCNTLKAHRLLLLALRRGGPEAQIKLLNALYQATFERGENVSDVDVLSSYAHECSPISKEEAIEFLKSDELVAEVHHMVSYVQQSGVSGVPFAVINGRWAISGGQSSDVFYEIFEKLVKGQEP